MRICDRCDRAGKNDQEVEPIRCELVPFRDAGEWSHQFDLCKTCREELAWWLATDPEATEPVKTNTYTVVDEGMTEAEQERLIERRIQAVRDAITEILDRRRMAAASLHKVGDGHRGAAMADAYTEAMRIAAHAKPTVWKEPAP